MSFRRSSEVDHRSGKVEPKHRWNLDKSTLVLPKAVSQNRIHQRQAKLSRDARLAAMASDNDDYVFCLLNEEEAF